MCFVPSFTCNCECIDDAVSVVDSKRHPGAGLHRSVAPDFAGHFDRRRTFDGDTGRWNLDQHENAGNLSDGEDLIIFFFQTAATVFPILDKSALFCLCVCVYLLNRSHRSDVNENHKCKK